MIVLAIASTLAFASADTSASAQRSALSKCLKEAAAKAKSDDVPAEGFDAFARAQCSAPEADLRKAVMAIDLRNGISRKDAAENANLDVDDYYLSTAERYEAEVAARAPKKVQAEAQSPPPPPQ